MAERLIESWTLAGSEPGPDLVIFKARFDRLRNPRNGIEKKAVVLEIRDWVNVLPITPEGKIVTVQQYRFGTRSVTTEFPAGLVERNEPHREAAMRELREETGYTTRAWEYLGYVEPNPAFLGNVCHQWLARDVVKTHETDMDEGEDILVREMTQAELQWEVKAGRMRNAMTVLALHRLFNPWEACAQDRVLPENGNH